jgi:hypothetical protein
MEYFGLHDELMLNLKWAKKYVWEDQPVRVSGRDGWPWMMVPHEAITDEYGIELNGTRSLVHKNEMVKRMMRFLPMLINNPNVPNQQEVLRESKKTLDIFPNADKLLEAGPGGMPQGGAPPGAGVGGTPTLQNDMQGTAGGFSM